MKLIHFLTNRTGKTSLSAMQAVGLSAVVGVAGIALWQMMSTPSESNLNTVFASSDDREVVYVAGAGGGGYASANYGAGGELQSGLRARMSDDMRLMQQDAAQAAEIEANTPAFIQQEQEIKAFKMDGAAVGLGMGANAANEMGVDLSAGGMNGIQQQIASIQASLSEQQKAALAAGQAAAGGNVAEAAAQAALAAQGAEGGAGQGGLADGMARAAGSNLGSTPLQAGQGAHGQGGASASGVLGGSAVAGAAGADGAMEGFTAGRTSTSSFGKALSWQGGEGVEYLASLQKQSADITQNRDRSANEATRVFMSGERLSGGIRLDGDTLTTGSASSSDFSSDDAISSLGAGMGNIESDVETYADAREKLADDMLKYNNKVATSCGIGQVLCNLWIWKFKKDMDKKIDAFEEAWGDHPYVTMDTQGNIVDSARKLSKKIFVRGSSSLTFLGVLTSMFKSEYGDEGRHVWGVEEKKDEEETETETEK